MEQLFEADDTPIRKTGGFQNESYFILPEPFLAEMEENTLFSALRVTDIGFFPKALYHERTRETGCDTAILLYCREGKGFFTLGQEAEQALLPGQALFIPPGTPHRYRASSRQPWSLYWIHLEGTLVSAYQQMIGAAPVLTIHSETAGDILREFHRCFALLRQHCQAEEYFLVCQSAGTILALVSHSAKLTRLLLTEKGGQAVDACLRHMEARLSQPLDMRQLTELSGFSASHLTALFKQSTGHAPMAHFHRMKMQMAANELAFTDKTVKEIGLACGMRDPYYFSRLFKSIMGLSPVQYRERAYR